MPARQLPIHICIVRLCELVGGRRNSPCGASTACTVCCPAAGILDASLKVDRSLAQPILGGDVRLSRGTAFLLPQGGGPGGGGGGGASERGASADRAADAEASIVSKAFTALTARKGTSTLSRSLSRLELQVGLWTCRCPFIKFTTIIATVACTFLTEPAISEEPCSPRQSRGNIDKQQCCPSTYLVNPAPAVHDHIVLLPQPVSARWLLPG